MIGAALAWFEEHFEAVNALNVFPVPDGDTGTNMLLTMRSAYARVENDESTNVSHIAARLAEGALYGARGNSGTVVSQFMRGFASVLGDAESLDAALLISGFKAALKAGYATFQKPLEGTILTVAREMVDAASAATTTDLRLLLDQVLAQGRASVARTPDLLPILKQAGVVDSGGQGLVILFEGVVRFLNSVSGLESEPYTKIVHPTAISRAALHDAYALSAENDDDGFGYDVQYLIRGHALDVDAIREAIQNMGHSAIVVGDAAAVKVHVHVPDPAVPLDYGKSWGVVEDVVVEDMQAQSAQYFAMRTLKTAAGQHLTIQAVAPGEIAVIAVAPGDGLKHVFYALGAAAVVDGGPTMNPSAGELLDAIERVNAERVILLPNNPNVILAAQQAAQLFSRGNAVILPTRSVPQGIAAMSDYVRTGNLTAVREAMQGSAARVVSGEITTATRDVRFEGVDIHSGQCIGLINDRPAVAGTDVTTVTRDLITKMLDSDEAYDLLTLYYGDLVALEDAEALVEALRMEYDIEIEFVDGGQSLYHYLISLE